MKSQSLSLRSGQEEDIEEITRVYAAHVARGNGSFEEVAPDTAEMLRRWRSRERSGHPTLIAEVDGRFSGFAYAGVYNSRSAYRFTVEDSIYVSPEFVGCGVGSALLPALIDRCISLGYRQMIAVIGDSKNHPSVALHRRCGFRDIGTAEQVGFKNGQWLDVVFMQRALHR
ncbi:MAG: N-acetyltransferase family protein [Granulosicoccus sp.]